MPSSVSSSDATTVDYALPPLPPQAHVTMESPPNYSAMMSACRLPVDLDNLRPFDDSTTRQFITPIRRKAQPYEISNQLMVVVGLADTTMGRCVHLYGGLCSHAIAVIDDFEMDIRPIGTWVVCKLRKIHEEALDPIMWQVVEAVVTQWPVDQFGVKVEVVGTGDNDEIVIKCRAIITHISRAGRICCFNDVLFRLATGGQDPFMLPAKTSGDRNLMKCVDVTAIFSLKVNEVAWRIAKIERVPSITAKDLTSDVLLTSDKFVLTERRDGFVIACHPQLGTVIFGFELISDFQRSMINEQITPGHPFRLTFACHGAWQRAIKSVRVTFLPCHEATHPPINPIDHLSETQMTNLMLNLGICGRLVREHAVPSALPVAPSVIPHSVVDVPQPKKKVIYVGTEIQKQNVVTPRKDPPVKEAPVDVRRPLVGHDAYMQIKVSEVTVVRSSSNISCKLPSVENSPSTPRPSKGDLLMVIVESVRRHPDLRTAFDRTAPGLAASLLEWAASQE